MSVSAVLIRKSLMKLRHAMVLLALVGAWSAHAQTNLGVNLKVGSAGLGADLVVPLNDGLNLRVGHASYKTDRSLTEDNVNYQAQLTLGGSNVLADWFPSKTSRFRWTLGAYSPRHSLTGQARPGEGGTIEINNIDYPAAALGELDLSVKWGGFKPYLGFGFDGFRHAKRAWYFNLDAGVIVAGSPKVSLTANCPRADVCAALESDLRAEEAQLKSDFSSLKYLPVVQFGVGYRF